MNQVSERYVDNGIGIWAETAGYVSRCQVSDVWTPR
jgi:hypothetical protein